MGEPNAKGSNGVYDVLGVGIGPFNLGLAALLDNVPDVQAVFFDRKHEFDWHAGMLLDGTTLQVPFFADLATMADPTNRFTFLNYLREMGRLYAFYFLERFHIPRSEYNLYCRWAAQQLASCRFGSEVEHVALETAGDGTSVYAADIRDIASGRVTRYRARHLVLGVGGVPRLGPRFAGLPADDVFHSADFLPQLARCRKAKSITVIGSGQSAAEIFYQLLKEQGERGYRLDWFTRSAGFFPMEYSKLGLEHFSPDYTNYFYSLPQAKKDAIRAGQNLLYKGISAKTIADIYDALYEASIGGVTPDVRLLAATEVTDIAQRPEGEGGGYRLSCRHMEQERDFTHDSEVVIMATGYSQPIPACVRSLLPLVQLDAEGRYEVEADYRLKLKGVSTAGRVSSQDAAEALALAGVRIAAAGAPAGASADASAGGSAGAAVRSDGSGAAFGGGPAGLDNRIYVQNGELHTHGVGAPDLGLGAYRNSVIINSIAGKTVYPVLPRNVFQQFGVGRS